MRRLTAWLHRGPFTARDLGIFRIGLGVFLLLTQTSLQWIDQMPSSFYRPPYGPFRLTSSLPPPGFFSALDIVLVVAIVAMTLGLATRWSSIAVSVLMVLGFGFAYSFGKIDHSILIALAPAILSFSNWGAEFSLDARLRRGTVPPIRQWAVRALAVAIGVSFATAAWAKLSSGWLLVKTQSAHAYFLQSQFTGGKHDLVTVLALSVHSHLLWEAVDWATVLFEALMAIAFVSWRLLRVSVAIATVFHLVIYLLLGIEFDWNVVTYGAFVAWGRVPVPRTSPTVSRVARACGYVVLAGLVIVDALQVGVPNQTRFPDIAPAVLVLGAVVGVGYLLWLIVRGRARPAPIVDQPAPGRSVRVLAAVVVLAMVVSLPVTVAVKQAKGEPYPALFQPGFAAPGPQTGDRIIATRVNIQVTFSDGSTRHVGASALLPSTSEQTTEFTSAFFRRAVDHETRAWLAARLVTLFAPLRATKLTADWVQTKYDPQTGQVKFKSVVYSTSVALGAGG